MTKAEVKREHREAEGDPQIKTARQRAYRDMLAAATINAVRDATVVIVNPEHLATALRYQEGEDDAPRVVASADGELAQKIQEAARAYGIPIVRDVPVARALAELEVGDAIPEALYEAVAEILREIWEAEEKSARGEG
jgi:flagellar biosynthesis protein FlhB